MPKRARNRFVYMLTSVNMTNVGLAMGMAHTYDNWSKPFASLETAQQFAEKDYGKSIEWKRDGHAIWNSGDLSYVMYYIRKEQLR